MKRLSFGNGLAIVAILLLMLLLGGTALAQDGGTVVFTNLADGDTVSELTTLTGTIVFPEFRKYELFVKSGKNLIWVANSHSPVTDGNLARLDPRAFKSGKYQMIVRQVHPTSNYEDLPGPTFTIENPNGAPAPYYPEIEPSFLYPADGFALVRARNCAGDDFFFDYSSPDGHTDSGEVLLPGKSGDVICRFTDFILTPGLYRGTAKGGVQTSGQPIEFQAEPGKVYDITYYGDGARIQAVEVPGDDPTAPAEGMTPAPTTAAPTVAPTTAPKKAATTAPTVAAPTPAVTATSDVMLPVSGDGEANASSAVALGAILLILALITGGVIAARRKSAV